MLSADMGFWSLMLIVIFSLWTYDISCLYLVYFRKKHLKLLDDPKILCTSLETYETTWFLTTRGTIYCFAHSITVIHAIPKWRLTTHPKHSQTQMISVNNEHVCEATSEPMGINKNGPALTFGLHVTLTMFEKQPLLTVETFHFAFITCHTVEVQNSSLI